MAPTMYFPLLVPECLMIEPTETESKETLDAFVEALREIVAARRRIRSSSSMRPSIRSSAASTKRAPPASPIFAGTHRSPSF